MKKIFTSSNILPTLLCIYFFMIGAVERGIAQDNTTQSNSDFLTVTITVRQGDPKNYTIYSNAKIWNANNDENIELIGSTDGNGVLANIKLYTNSKLIVGEFYPEEPSLNDPNLYTEVDLKGRNEIIVYVKEAALPEGLAVGNSKIMDVKGDIEGNTMVLSTKMIVNADLVNTNNRFIWQPVIINQKTKEIQYGRAFVLDGKEYSTTQLRNYDNKIKGGDPLYENGLVHISHDSLKLRKVTRYKRPVGKTVEIDYAKAHGYFVTRGLDTVYYKVENGDTIAFANRTDSTETYYYEFNTKDKIFVDHPLTPFAYAIETLSEDYEKLLIRDSVGVYIYGVLHPLRLLNVNFQYAEVDSSLYQQWWPRPMKGDRPTEGSVDLKFKQSESSLDNSDPQNAKELDRVEKLVTSIAKTRGTRFTGLVVSGKSSPEGNYSKNLSLAQGRLNTALKILKGYIPVDKRVREFDSRVETHPSVATWQEVADSLRKDSLFAEAEEIMKIVRTYDTGRISEDMNNQGKRIRQLPCYQMIVEKYLPKFRRVDFIIKTFVNRSATIDEIRDMYKSGEYMDEYSFHQLYANEPDTLLRYKYCKEAYERYPNCIIFRTDHAGHLIAQNKPDTALLSEYTYWERFTAHWDEGKKYKVPEETRINQVISYIKMENFDKAYKVAETYLSGKGRSEFAKYLAQAYAGKLYNEDGSINDTIISAVSKSSTMNEIIIRMAVKNNNEQLQQADALCDSLLQKNKMDAMANFLKAICLKRKGNKGSKDWNRATIHLYRALEADPQLIELAKTDRDLYERLYDEEMPVPILRHKEDWEYELGLTK